MLNIVAKITPKPAKFDECLERIQAIIPITREEPGCLRFEIYIDDEARHIFLIERFVNALALDAHYEQDYTKTVFAFYQGALANPVHIEKMYEP